MRLTTHWHACPVGVAADRSERLYALYVLALCLGVRRGVLVRWEDVRPAGCRACGAEGGTRR